MRSSNMGVKRAAGLAALAASTVVAQTSTCAQIADLLSTQPGAMIKAEAAYACLQEVPNKTQPAVDLVASLKAFINWQSSLAWLKSPPDDYEVGSIDLLGTLDDISSKASNGEYASEYDFQLAIYQAMFAAHDGHLSYTPDIFIPFVFANDLAYDLVSVSTDGLEVPKLYHFQQLAKLRKRGSSDMPPAVTQINGQDAASFVEDVAKTYSPYQDPDSMWNSQFPNYVTQAVTGALAASVQYMGPNLTFTYDDGSEVTGDSYAYVPNETFDVYSGEQFYEKWCEPSSSSFKRDGALATVQSKGNKTVDEAFVAYKQHMDSEGIEPMAIQTTSLQKAASGAGGTVNGFFLGGDYSDTAVLQVTAFSPDSQSANANVYLNNFQSTVEDFLAQCDSNGMSKLVVDVTGNGGGLVQAGFELFAQLFPDVEQWAADNIRLHEGSQGVADVMDSVGADFQPSTQDEATAWQILFEGAIGSNFYPGNIYTPEGDSFTSTDELMGPVNLNGDSFTAYQDAPLNQTSGTFNLTGTGDKSSPRPAVFDPANVVILTDGTCGSTCTIFSYLMINQVGVRVTTAGGRPKTGTMQGIAGVEGAQIFYMSDLSQTAAAAIYLASDPTSLQNGQLGLLSDGLALQRAASDGGVNGKNSFPGNNAQTPFQFLNEPANCRFFYTFEMINDAELVWQRAVDASFNDADSWCVADSQTDVKGVITETDKNFEASQDNPDAGNNGSSDDDQGVAAAMGAGEGVRMAVLLVGLTVLMGML